MTFKVYKDSSYPFGTYKRIFVVLDKELDENHSVLGWFPSERVAEKICKYFNTPGEKGDGEKR